MCYVVWRIDWPWRNQLSLWRIHWRLIFHIFQCPLCKTWHGFTLWLTSWMFVESQVIVCIINHGQTFHLPLDCCIIIEGSTGGDRYFQLQLHMWCWQSSAQLVFRSWLIKSWLSLMCVIVFNRRLFSQACNITHMSFFDWSWIKWMLEVFILVDQLGVQEYQLLTRSPLPLQ